MRNDVKLGLLFSFVIVVVAGWYYVDRDATSQPVELDDSAASKPDIRAAPTRPPTRPADAPRAKSPTSPDRRPASRKPSSARPTPGRPVPKPSVNRTTPTGGAAPARPPVAQPKPRVSPGTSGNATKPPRTPAVLPNKGTGTPERNAIDELFKLKTGGGAAPGTPVPPPNSGPPPVQPTTRRPAVKSSPAVTPSQPRTPSEKPGLPKAARPSVAPQLHAPETAPTVPPAGTRMHTVQRGDSYALLAEHYYGSQRHTQFLMKANPERADPRKLRPGMTLRVPPLPKDAGKIDAPKIARKPSAGPAGRRTYVVREGDTFYDIAARELGSSGRWTELFELNRQLVDAKPERLRPGQVLALPEAPSTSPAKAKRVADRG